jgi:hypothetical protein
MKRQIRQSERQRPLFRGGKPDRLQAEKREREARQGAEREGEAAREERIAPWNERSEADRQPDCGDGERTCQR